MMMVVDGYMDVLDIGFHNEENKNKPNLQNLRCE
jgi:hypothetical protein